MTDLRKGDCLEKMKDVESGSVDMRGDGCSWEEGVSP